MLKRDHEANVTSACFGSQFDCERFLGEGWSRPECDFVWTEGRRSICHIGTFACDADGVLRIGLSVFFPAGHTSQVLRIAANFSIIASQIVETEHVELSLFVPAETLALADTLQLTFYNACPGRPSDREPTSTDDRWLAFALRSIALEPLHGPEAAPTQWPAGLLDDDAPGDAIERERAGDLAAARRCLDLFAADRSMPRLFEAYLRNVGATTYLRHTFFEVIEGLRHELSEDGGLSPLGEGKQLSPEIVARFVPRYRHLSFDLEAEDGSKTIPLLAQSDLAFFDATLSAHELPAFRSPTRPRIDLRQLDDALVLLHPYGYLVATSDGRTCMRDANVKGMSRAALDARRVRIDRPIVIVQDFYDGGNIAHFLFDSITRVFHFCAAMDDEARRALFVFGGRPTAFHRVVLAATADLLGLSQDQFYFPGSAVVVTAPQAFWFSDQVLNLHPAQWMHPASVAIFGRLAEALAFQTGTRRLYVSRSDAGTRRLANEAALFAELEPRGFEFVRLADLPFMEQMALMASSSTIVAPHGMGLTHLAFTRGSPRLVEIFHPTLLSGTCALLAKARGFRYDYLFGTALPGSDNDYEVDIDACLALEP